MTAAFCPQCGTGREAGTRYCSKCGHDFEQERAPSQPISGQPGLNPFGQSKLTPVDGGTRLGQSISQGFGFGCGCLLLVVAIFVVLIVIGNLN